MKFISIQTNLGIAKYRQIIQSVEKAIIEGQLQKGESLPSVNQVCMRFSLSRDTVLLAYDELKKRGIIYAIPGKGYYVRSTDVGITRKVFLLFDELNIFKEDIYNAFLEHISGDTQVEIFFHHFNAVMFRKLVEDANGNYSKYIIMPTNLPEAAAIIKTLPVKDVYILDQTNAELESYPGVYQNFTKDIYDALLRGKLRLDRYRKMILIFPGFREPLGMKTGFLQYCADFSIDHEVITEFAADREIKKGEVYVIPSDRDLVRVLEKGKSLKLAVGNDYGIISYNETPLKKVAANGITTISTDFEAMGKILAQLILTGQRKKIANKCALIIRTSL